MINISLTEVRVPVFEKKTLRVTIMILPKTKMYLNEQSVWERQSADLNCIVTLQNSM